MSNIIQRCIEVIGGLLATEVCQNVSFHPQFDYIEISNEVDDTNPEQRDAKFPCLIIRGPRMKRWDTFRTLQPIITKNIQEGTYQRVPQPEIYDIDFKIIVLSEGDIEAFDIATKVVAFFRRNVNLNVDDVIYNITLDSLKDSEISYLNDLVRYEGVFCVEGVEIYDELSITTGKLVTSEPNPNVLPKTQ